MSSFVFWSAGKIQNEHFCLQNAYSILSLKHYYSPQGDLQIYSISQFKIQRIKVQH